MTFISNPTVGPSVSPSGNWMLEAARGNLDTISHINKFGSNKDIDTATTPEDLWGPGGVWVPPTAARIHDIASTSASDTSAGVGIRTLRLTGLDSSWNEVTEDVTMNGTTNVATTGTFWRIYRMSSLTSGSSNVNVGNITATAQTDSTVTAHIEAGNSQTLMAIYTVPAGKTAYMTRAYGTLDRTQAGNALVQMTIRNRIGLDTGDNTLLTKHIISFATDGTSAHSWIYIPYKAFQEKTDIFWRIDSVSANNLQVHGGFDLIIVDN